MSFIRGSNPIWFFNNLTGAPLDDMYFAFFLTNDLPYVPQPVFHDPNGINPWSDPIEFQPNAGLPDNIYGDPNLVYRIEIRQGPTQVFPLIYLIENYIFGNSFSSSSIINFQNSNSQITNPQFAFVNFTNGNTSHIPPFALFTISAAGTYNIAPGWDLVLAGTGTTTLQQFGNPGTNNNGPPPVPGNPPFYLEIVNSAGWSTAKLIQTINGNGAIFNNGSISMSILVRPNISAQTFSLEYLPSGAPNPTQIVAPTSEPAGIWSTLARTINVVSPSLNTNVPPNASVQLIVNLPNVGSFDITNIQFVGQETAFTSQEIANNFVPLFQETTPQQQQNDLFNVYADSIIMQPKSSLLTGWNFGLNPWQFTTKAPTNVATNTYTADQTIVVQQNYVQNTLPNDVAVFQANSSFNFGFGVQAASTNNNFAIIQFIAPTTIGPYWNSVLSSLVKLSLITSQGTMVRFKMRLIVNTTIPASLSQHYPIASWVEGQDPAFAPGFAVIAPKNDPAYILGGLNQTFAFDGFKLPAATTSTMVLGIVLYTIDNMSPAATADIIVINDVSLVPNDFAIASNPLSFDETLRRCEYYYESSYEIGIIPGGAVQTTGITIPISIQYNGTNYVAHSSPFYFSYRTVKWIVPLLTVYDGATAGSVHIDIYANNTNVPNAVTDVVFGAWWAVETINTKLCRFVPGNAAPLLTSTALAVGLQAFAQASFHYTADARIAR